MDISVSMLPGSVRTVSTSSQQLALSSFDGNGDGGSLAWNAPNEGPCYFLPGKKWRRGSKLGTAAKLNSSHICMGTGGISFLMGNNSSCSCLRPRAWIAADGRSSRLASVACSSLCGNRLSCSSSSRRSATGLRLQDGGSSTAGVGPGSGCVCSGKSANKIRKEKAAWAKCYRSPVYSGTVTEGRRHEEEFRQQGETGRALSDSGSVVEQPSVHGEGISLPVEKARQQDESKPQEVQRGFASDRGMMAEKQSGRGQSDARPREAPQQEARHEGKEEGQHLGVPGTTVGDVSVPEKSVALPKEGQQPDAHKQQEEKRDHVGDQAKMAEELWQTIRDEARRDSEAEPVLASYLYSTILVHRSLERALAFHIANKLASTTFLSTQLFTLISDTFMEDADIRAAIHADIRAVKSRDPACVSYSHCLLNFKGFLACQSYRVSHRLWKQGRSSLAFALQSRVSEVFHVDFHPAAKIGHGVLFDHATGVVVGETAEIGNNVSILHQVTLGGTGASGGARHPKVGDGVLIGAGATILGPVNIGEGAKIGAGSVVLTDIPAHCTAVGNPARLLGGKTTPAQLKEIPSENMDHTSFIHLWSDYSI